MQHEVSSETLEGFIKSVVYTSLQRYYSEGNSQESSVAHFEHWLSGQRIFPDNLVVFNVKPPLSVEERKRRSAEIEKRDLTPCKVV